MASDVRIAFVDGREAGLVAAARHAARKREEDTTALPHPDARYPRDPARAQAFYNGMVAALRANGLDASLFLQVIPFDRAHEVECLIGIARRDARRIVADGLSSLAGD